jgi:hypothetical protein
MKVAFFGYAWNAALQPDAYMTETFQSLAQAGADVDVFLGQHLSKEYGIYGLNEAMPLGKLRAALEEEGYDAAISFNNSMILPELAGAIPGKTVSVIVDAPEHLFDYQRTGPYDPMRGDDVEIVAMSSVLERQLIEAIPGVEPRLHFMLPATHIDPGARSMNAAYPISWVASYVGDLNLDQYLKLAADRPDFHALTQRCLNIVARDGDLRAVKTENGSDAALIANLPWSFDYFQAQMQNILTNRSRVEVVERLSPHGLALFGNAGWQKLLTHNAAVMAALQSGPALTAHADLRRVYNASKISINLPQAHVTQDAVQYRVIDVLGSNALMITKHSPTSDLYRVFGSDCPIPTYADLGELETKCAYFLANEEERRSLVVACNALVAKGFTFAERAVELLKIAGLEPPPVASAGQVRRIDLRPLMT